MGIKTFISGLTTRSNKATNINWGWGTPTSSGVRVTAESAITISAVYACVRILSETLASLPLILYRRRGDGGKERATDHPAYKLMHDRPNNFQTRIPE